MCLADLRLGGDRAELRDFAHRFNEGPPWDQFDVDEADFRYRQVSGHLSAQEYDDAVCGVLARLEPQERRQFAHLVADRCATRGLEFDPDGDHGPECYEDPRTLAGLVSKLREGCQPNGGLEQLLAGRDGLCKVVLAGIAASALQQL